MKKENYCINHISNYKILNIGDLFKMMKRKLKVMFIALCLSFIFILTTSSDSIIVTAWENTAIPVCTAPEDQTIALSTPTSDGGVIIAWGDNRNLDYDIYAQKFDMYGNPQWTIDGVAVYDVPGSQYVVMPCSDGAGGGIFVILDYNPGDPDIYAQRIDSSGNRVWDPDGVPICTEEGSQGNFDICSDGSGGVIIAWQDERTGTNEFDIYAQKINQNGVTLWGANGILVCNATERQLYPKVVSDLSGGVHITWSDRRLGSSNEDRDIYAQRLNSTGVPQWTYNGVGICTASMEQNFPFITGDISGNAIIAWMDKRIDSSYDIYAQKIDKSGTTLWDSDGVAICTANGFQSGWKMCSDNSDGAIIVWEDNRDGLQYDIYAQRVNVAGSTRWNPNGTIVCSAAFNQNSGNIIADGDAGAIVAWQDYRNNASWQIYSQRINENGTGLWGINGMVVDPIPNEDQLIPSLVLAETGAAIITWEDRRNSANLNIWAHFFLDTRFPTCTSPSDASYACGSTAFIPWSLWDNAGGGDYQISKNGTPFKDWTKWDPWEALNVPIDTSSAGDWLYAIAYNDTNRNFGIPDYVLITISSCPSPDIGAYSLIMVVSAGAVIITVYSVKRRKKRQ